jgi:hypothetical protein
MAVTQSELEELGDFLRGTCRTVEEGLEACGLADKEGMNDSAEFESLLLDVDIELCVHCHWWHEVCELTFNENQGGGLCDDCLDELGLSE